MPKSSGKKLGVGRSLSRLKNQPRDVLAVSSSLFSRRWLDRARGPRSRRRSAHGTSPRPRSAGVSRSLLAIECICFRPRKTSVGRADRHRLSFAGPRGSRGPRRFVIVTIPRASSVNITPSKVAPSHIAWDLRLGGERAVGVHDGSRERFSLGPVEGDRHLRIRLPIGTADRRKTTWRDHRRRDFGC
jgi:hypothetical protein